MHTGTCAMYNCLSDCRIVVWCGRVDKHITCREVVSPTTTIQSRDAPFSFVTMRMRREEPPSPAGGPTQSQISRLMSSAHHFSLEQRQRRKHPQFNSDTLQLSRLLSSAHHISMEHRLKRKHLQLNCDTDASNEICSKGKEQKQQKRKWKHKKKRRKTHESGESHSQ